MRLVGKRRLALQPDALVRTGSGQVVTLSRKPLQSAFLHAYGSAIELLWSTEVRPDALGAFARGDLVEVFDRAGISGYDEGGGQVHRLEFPVHAACGLEAPLPSWAGSSLPWNMTTSTRRERPS